MGRNSNAKNDLIVKMGLDAKELKAGLKGVNLAFSEVRKVGKNSTQVMGTSFEKLA